MVETRRGRGTESETKTSKAKYTSGAQPYNLRSTTIEKRKRKKNTARTVKVKREVPALPPEIWCQILTYLRGSEKLLLQLRLVSWQWRALVDDILTQNSAPYLNSWKSYRYSGKELWISNRNFVTSRFRFWEELEVALKFPIEGDSTGSPFPTGVVVFSPYYGWRRNDVLEQNRLVNFNLLVSRFLSRFGKWISTLVYFFHSEDSSVQPISHFRDSILKASGVRNLFMCSGNLDPYQLVLPHHSDQHQAPNLSGSLRQLQLGSEVRFFEGPTLILLFVRFSSVLESLTSLEFDWPRRPHNDLVSMMSTDPGRLLHCPQLQRLKIGNPTLEILRCFCKPEPDSSPRLNELSLIIKDSDEETFLLFQELIPLLDIHARWLTSFTLEIVDQSVHRGLRKLFGEDEEDPSFFQDTGVQFPELRKVGIHLDSVLQHEDWDSDLQTLFRKFPNVEQVLVSGYWEATHSDHILISYLELWLTPRPLILKRVVPGMLGEVERRVGRFQYQEPKSNLEN